MESWHNCTLFYYILFLNFNLNLNIFRRRPHSLIFPKEHFLKFHEFWYIIFHDHIGQNNHLGTFKGFRTRSKLFNLISNPLKEILRRFHEFGCVTWVKMTHFEFWDFSWTFKFNPNGHKNSVIIKFNVILQNLPDLMCHTVFLMTKTWTDPKNSSMVLK